MSYELNTSDSYSNIFRKKKEQLNRSLNKHNGGRDREYDHALEHNMNGNYYNQVHQTIPISKSTKSLKPIKTLPTPNITNVIDYNIDEDRRLSPKAHYKFKKDVIKRCQSKDNLSAYSVNSGYSSVNNYLERRHTESQNRLQRIKDDKIDRELGELKDRPTISRNSKNMMTGHIDNPMHVVDRLTSKYYDRKKKEEVSKIHDLSNMNSNKPQVRSTIYIDKRGF
jgi:hypothetical protein